MIIQSKPLINIGKPKVELAENLCYTAMKKFKQKYGELKNISDMFNPDMALAIVVNPNTGEILGMGSLPDFDPNNYKEYGTSVLNRNLPIWSSYEPGSTFKNVNTIQ